MGKNKLKDTPLKSFHSFLNAKFIDFNSYYMPLSYSSIIEEVILTRNNVSFFDLYHMGRLLVKKNENLNKLFSISIDDIKIGKAKYSLILNSSLTIEDDIVIYNIEEYIKDHFLVVCNSVNKEKNMNLLKEFGINVEDVSNDYLMIAIQGPISETIVNNILESLFNKKMDLKGIYFYDYVMIDKYFILSRSGYTGEDGFEIYLDYNRMIKLVEYLIDNGVKAAGLGARDVLRIEAGLPLYGNEINKHINPLEANLKWAVKNKYFQNLLSNIKIQKKLIGLKVINSKKVPRKDYKLFNYDNQEIGFITSGTYSPTLSASIGLGYINVSNNDEEGFIESNKNFLFKITDIPFVKTKYYKKNKNQN